MKLAIMQPYFFPYIGYFQMVAQVDRFVFLDDAAFIKNGWINRNRILLNGDAHYMTVPTRGAGSHVAINDVGVQEGSHWKTKLAASIRHAYGKAPNFKQVYPIFEATIESNENRMSRMAEQSVVECARYLGLRTEFVASSSRYQNRHLAGTARVLDICRQERADIYVNLPGGRKLYDPQAFSAQGVELRFVSPNLAAYPQGSSEFIAGLSIVDVMMWVDRDRIAAMVGECGVSHV